MIFRASFISILVLSRLAACGQAVDSALLDLKQLKDVDFFKKYSLYDEETTRQDIRVTKLVWSLKQLRAIDMELRKKGVPTSTRVETRPTKDSRYYLIGHYQLPTADHLMRMSFYRVDTLRKTFDYQSLDDFAKNEWRRVK